MHAGARLPEPCRTTATKQATRYPSGLPDPSPVKQLQLNKQRVGCRPELLKKLEQNFKLTAFGKTSLTEPCQTVTAEQATSRLSGRPDRVACRRSATRPSFSLFHLAEEKKKQKEKTRFEVLRVSHSAECDSGRCPENPRAFEKARPKLLTDSVQLNLTHRALSSN